jgi:hypothetical protein
VVPAAGAAVLLLDEVVELAAGAADLLLEDVPDGEALLFDEDELAGEDVLDEVELDGEALDLVSVLVEGVA